MKLAKLWPLDDPEALVGLISQVSGQPVTQVAPRLLGEFANTCSTVPNLMKQAGIPFHKMTPALQDFYQHSDGFLYETSVAHHGTAKYHQQVYILTKLQEFCKPGASKILCFGDGMGLDSARLAQHGYDVTYSEPGMYSNQCAQLIFDKNAVNVQILPSLRELKPNSLDAIVCLDVLEHVETPGDIVALFKKWLKPDGILFCHAPFWLILPELATHLQCNLHLTADWKTLYRPHGFEPLDAAFVWCPLVLQQSHSPHKIPQTWAMWWRVLLNQLFLWPAKYLPVYIWYFRYFEMPHKKETIDKFCEYNDRVQQQTKTSNNKNMRVHQVHKAAVAPLKNRFR